MTQTNRITFKGAAIAWIACLILALGLACFGPSAYADSNDKDSADTCTITFKANSSDVDDSKAMKDQKVDKGKATELNANKFKRDGYDFKNWNTKADGSGKSYKDKAKITAEKDTKLYAQWEKAEDTSDSVKSQSTAKDGTDDSGNDADKAKGESDDDDSDKTKDGTDADQAKDGDSTKAKDESSDKDANADDDKDANADTPSSTKKGTANDVLLPQAVNDEDKPAATEDDKPATQNEDDVIKAQANDITITFHANEGTGTMDPQTATAGDVKLNKNNFTREGYSFTGWCTDAKGETGQAYTDEETVTLNADTDLYAQWAKDHVITFNANGGTGTMENQSVPLGKSAELSKNTFTYAGYTFAGWKDAAGTSYTDGQTVTPTADMALSAQWTKNPDVAITFNANGGTGTMGNQTVTSGLAATLNGNAFTFKGHTFTGWNTKADGTGTPYADTGSITITENTTLFAQWQQSTVTITFNKNGGKGTMGAQSALSGDKTTLAANKFTRSGYDFTGWNTKANGKGTSYTDKESITPTGNMTLYAQWEKAKHTITFDRNGGTGTMSDQEVTDGEEETLNENKFTRSGYTFNGWNTQANGKGKSYSNKGKIKATEDMTLYAQWKKNSTSNSANKSGSSSSSSKAATKTGDPLEALPFVIIAIVAAGVVIGALVYRRRLKSDIVIPKK